MYSKRCTKCNFLKFSEDFYKDLRRKDGLFSCCKTCHLIKTDNWARNNRDKINAKRALIPRSEKEKSRTRERAREYYLKNQEVCKEKAREWGLKNKKARNSRAKAWAVKNGYPYQKQWEALNPGLRNSYNAKRRGMLIQATPAWADEAAIQDFYIVAKFMSDMEGIQYHVDHIIPLQGEKVCGLHCQFNLQIIPAKENLQKSNKFVDDSVKIDYDANIQSLVGETSWSS